MIDLFAGAGGLSLGFAREGFEVVAAIEYDADAAATHRLAHRQLAEGTLATAPPAATARLAGPGTAAGRGAFAGGAAGQGGDTGEPTGGPVVTATVTRREVAMVVGDICQVDFTRWRGQVDVVVGGPPCQPWSLGGLRQGHADPRDGIPQFARAVDEIGPRAFVMENVAGLAQGAARPAFERIVRVLRGDEPLRVLLGAAAGRRRLDYQVGFLVLQAADHGVPQRRRRLFVIGTRRGLGFEWPAPSFGPGTDRPYRPAGAVLGPEPVGEPNYSIVTYAANPSIRPDPYHGHLFNGGGRPIDLTRPAPTLLASMGGNKTPWVDTLGLVPDYHRHLLAGGAARRGRVPGARRITIAEAAALQTFPGAMALVGAKSSQYRQVGNAVPPTLAAAVARRLRLALEP